MFTLRNCFPLRVSQNLDDRSIYTFRELDSICSVPFTLSATTSSRSPRVGAGCHQDGDRSGLTSLPLPRTTTVQEQEITEGILERGVRWKHPTALQRPRQTAYKISSCTRMAPPLPQSVQHQEERFLRPLVSSGGKGNPRGVNPSPPYHGSLVGAATLISHHRGCRTICGAQPLGILTRTEKGEEGPATGSTRSAHVVTPTSRYSQLQNKLAAHDARELGWVETCLILILR